jgi:hypothetical protein
MSVNTTKPNALAFVSGGLYNDVAALDAADYTTTEASRNTDMAAAVVQNAYAYITRGVSRTGTLSGGGSSPSTPTISIDSSTGTVTITGTDAGTTNTLYYKSASTAAWTSGGTRTGNGIIARPSGLSNYTAYYFVVVSVLGNCSSMVSNLVTYSITTCTLPSAGTYVTDEIVETYQDAIDALISDMGRTVTLNMLPSVIKCPNCILERVGQKWKSLGRYNPSNPNPVGGALNKIFVEGVCPVCSGSATIATVQTHELKGLIQWGPKEIESDIEGRNLINICRVKCLQSCHESYIMKCIEAVVDGIRVKLWKVPSKRGIRDIRYINSYWERIDNNG